MTSASSIKPSGALPGVLNQTAVFSDQQVVDVAAPLAVINVIEFAAQAVINDEIFTDSLAPAVFVLSKRCTMM